MTKVTFKQYLDSRAQLLKAIENTPITVEQYEVRKYCSLTLGESEDEKEIIGLKPKTQLFVEWSHADVYNPTPESIRIGDDDTKREVFWAGNKLQKWLIRHATKEDSDV